MGELNKGKIVWAENSTFRDLFFFFFFLIIYLAVLCLGCCM